MIDDLLKGRRILVVEDEYLLADDLKETLTTSGAEVIGPLPSIEEALTTIQRDLSIDAAILDVNLRGEMIFPVADELRARGVPFTFVTGYNEWALPERFAQTPRLEKPVKGRQVHTALLTLLG